MGCLRLSLQLFISAELAERKGVKDGGEKVIGGRQPKLGRESLQLFKPSRTAYDRIISPKTRNS